MMHDMEVKKMQQYSVKELRVRNNMTQAQSAEKLGVSTQTYNAWEKDISKVAIGKVEAIAELYGVTIGEIFLPKYMKNIHI